MKKSNVEQKYLIRINGSDPTDDEIVNSREELSDKLEALAQAEDVTVQEYLEQNEIGIYEIVKKVNVAIRSKVTIRENEEEEEEEDEEDED